jgi:Rieske Fe-S protein
MAEAKPPSVNRRTLLRHAGGGLLATSWLVACGSEEQPATGSSSSADGNQPSSSGGGTAGSGGSDGGSDGGAGGGEAIAATADIAVGGGVIVDDKYVVTQPVKGEFKAFSAICTHQGCPVGEVTGGQIVCPCHGSAFSIEDGSVVNGPAESPLAEEPISVDGGQVTLA